MESLEKQNASARKKSPHRPYYKARMEYVPACPYCDRYMYQPGGVNTPLYCKCGAWLPKLINREWAWLFVPDEA
jgi:hypothetical protein